MKIITNEQIQEILDSLSNRQTLNIKKILSELKEDTIRDDLGRIVRDNGRSNMISKSEIEGLLNEK